MSDRIGVMSEARLLQVGSPEDIYEHPTSRFVADFIGEINLLPATVVDGSTLELPGGHRVRGAVSEPAGAGVTVAVRPERLSLGPAGEAVLDGLNALSGRVIRRTYYGDVFYYDVDTPAGVVEVKEENRPDRATYAAGDTTIVSWDPAAMSVVAD